MIKYNFCVVLVLFIMLLGSSCLRKAQKEESTNNDEFKLELLFEKDGCKIYRFKNGGDVVYWTNCTGNIEYSIELKTDEYNKIQKKIQNITSAQSGYIVRDTCLIPTNPCGQNHSLIDSLIDSKYYNVGDTINLLEEKNKYALYKLRN